MKRNNFILKCLLIVIPIFVEGKTARVLVCEEKIIQKVLLSKDRITTLSFPVKPTEVAFGRSGFDVKYIGHDLLIRALQTTETNLFVYLPHRRCVFDLVMTQANSDELVLIKDPAETKMEIKDVKSTGS